MAQKNEALAGKFCDTLTKRQFLLQVKNSSWELKAHRNFSATRAKKLIRIYNTLFLDSLEGDSAEKKLFASYQRAIDRYYWVIWIKKWGGTIAKSGALYLEQLDCTILDLYDIRTGGFNCGDIYVISGSQKQ